MRPNSPRALLGAGYVQLLHSRQPVTVRSMILVATAGILLGGLFGYISMGVIHTFLELGTPKSKHSETHHHPTAIQTSRPNTHSQAAATTSATAVSATSTTDGSDAVPEILRDGAAAPWPTRGRGIHTLCTSNGSPYTNFQNRIMYGTYKIVQQMPGGENLVGFTRILHRTKQDEIMQEVPTFHAVPLTPKCDGWCEFPVADRPNAVRQFFMAALKDPSMIKGPWVLMLETDYVWMGPLQDVPFAESAAKGWAFPFGYILPTYPSIKDVMRTMFPESKGPLSLVPGTGPAPVLLRAADWAAVIPDWERLTAQIERTPEAKEKLGWVREMYAFSIACALKGVELDLTKPPNSRLIAQPPADHVRGKAAMLHYTWGSIFKDKNRNDEEVWKFDKRFFTDAPSALKVPKLPEPPAWREGLTLQDGVKVTPELVATLAAMVQRINEGSRGLRDLSQPSSR